MKCRVDHYCAALILILVSIGTIGYSQPFDTLLIQYHHLEEIYPLEDSTFILVGEGERVLVERINSLGESIWSTSFGQDEEDDIHDYAVHLHDNDSSIQVVTFKRQCDIYPYEKATVYTLSFSGELFDSIIVPFYTNNPHYVALLSGNSELPRLAYLKEKDVVLVYANGDTIHLRPGFANGDTSLSDLVGYPVRVAMCPGGNILIGTTGSFVFSFSKENDRYKVIDLTFGALFQTRGLFCIEDDNFIIFNMDHAQLWNHHYPELSWYLPEGYIESMVWRQPNFLVSAFLINGQDSIYLLDRFLEETYKAPISSEGPFISTYAIHNNITYSVGSANIYFEGGFLGSEDHFTHEGPKYYDVELVDIGVPVYDNYSIFNTCGYVRYLYHFPEIKITIKNLGDFPISNVTVYYDSPCSICGFGASWIRQIENMDLMPGESKTYSLQDVEIANMHPFRYPLNVCLTLLRPDNHVDDNFSYRDFCKEFTFTDLYPFEEGDRIRYFPNPATEELNFLTLDSMNYHVNLFDASGTTIINQQKYTGGHTSLDISQLSRGLYFLEFRFADGQTESGKFVKQ